MPLPRRDYLEFLFNGGRGIRRAQLHEDAGLPSYAAGSHKAVYVPADRDIVVTIDDLGTEPAPRPCLLYFIIPADIDRAGDGLTLVGNGTSGSLLFLDGRRVAARDLTPGSLGVVLAQHPGGTQGWIFIDQIHVRPQDWRLVYPLTTGFVTQSDVDSGPFTTSAQTPLDFTASSPMNRWLGVPVDAPEIINLRDSSGGLLNKDGAYGLRDPTGFSGWLGPFDYMGIPYRWLVVLPYPNFVESWTPVYDYDNY